MAENRLGIGDLVFPTPQSKHDTELKIALEHLVLILRDNIDYLLKPSIKTVTADYTATDLDHTVLLDNTSGGITLSLPDATVNQGLILNFVKTDASNTATLDGFSSQTINGSATHDLTAQYDAVKIQSDGSNWFILADK